MFSPLAITLFLSNWKAKKLGLTAPRPWAGLSFTKILKNLWCELDIGGIILLSAAFSLILIPLTIASKVSDGWRSGRVIAMLVIGVVCLFTFPFWESLKKLAPRPLIHLFLFKSRTFCAGATVGFFYFCKQFS
jgi:MFS family permease